MQGVFLVASKYHNCDNSPRLSTIKMITRKIEGASNELKRIS